MKKHLSLLLLLPLLFLASCEQTSKPRFEGDVYTIAGLLISGGSIDLDNPVYVTRSSTIEAFNPFEIFVGDAEVLIRDLDGNLEFPLEPALHEFKFKYVDPAGNAIQPGHRYRIEVSVPGQDSLIWAETTVPQAVELELDLWGDNPPNTGYSFDPETANTMPFSQIDSSYPIVVNTGDTAASFNFFGEIYCLEEFSTDLEFTNVVFGFENPDESLRDIYNAGGAFRRITFLNRLSSAPQPGIEGNYLVLGDYAYAFVLYGRYRVKVYVVDDNYYRYTYMEENYLHGGVHNALGYFGSASGGTLYTEVVR
ncbi:MAG: DUF4249 domain-containing protein [Candidatus Syntrophosphaera sp.]|nr:DUF4249 domain-containing protein [Candidatus Syntrophosphaera sp.]